MNINNPFLMAGYMGPDYFCDRERETAELVEAIENDRNVTFAGWVTAAPEGCGARRGGARPHVDGVYRPPRSACSVQRVPRPRTSA